MHVIRAEYQIYNLSWAARNILKIKFCGGIKLKTSQSHAYLSLGLSTGLDCYGTGKIYI